MVLVGVSLLDTKWCGVASWHVSVNFTKAITKTRLYIKTWFVCSNKFECLKTVETFQAPKHDSWCLLQICWQLWFWMLFRTLLSPSSLRDKNKLTFSDQCQTKFLLPKSQNEFYDLLTIPSCTSSTTTKAKGMENMLIFISLYEFKSSLCSPCNQSTQRRRKVYRCWVSSSPIKRAEHETCKYNVNHHGWAHHQGETKSLLPMQKRPNGFISPQMSDISSQMSYFHKMPQRHAQTKAKDDDVSLYQAWFFIHLNFCRCGTKLTSTVILRRQACHKLTSTVVLTWQAWYRWHLWHWVARLAFQTPVTPRHFARLLLALRDSPWLIQLLPQDAARAASAPLLGHRFLVGTGVADQAWHKLISTVIWWQAWHKLTTSFCVAGVDVSSCLSW